MGYNTYFENRFVLNKHEYLIMHFLRLWEYELSGEVTWYGEEQGDTGKIVIKTNEVTVKKRSNCLWMKRKQQIAVDAVACTTKCHIAKNA